MYKSLSMILTLLIFFSLFTPTSIHARTFDTKTNTATVTTETDESFSSNTSPTIRLRSKQSIIQWLTSKTNRLFKKPDSPTLVIATPKGKVIFKEQIIKKDDTITLDKNKLSPGLYTISVGNNLVTNFSWGVLALNTNKSVYTPNEIASLSFGVLDENGDMVCDAVLEAEITDPQKKVTKLTTIDKSIKVTPTCFSKEVTIKPDYYANFTTAISGTYDISLKAFTKNGTFTITDQFKVEDHPTLDIERITATRINPMKKYPVIIKIIPQADYKGTVTEHLPSTFITQSLSANEANKYTPVSNTESYNQYFITKYSGATQQLEWTVSWSKGKTYYLGYRYDSPDESPFAFNIGPLTTSIFTESRKWQLAVDAPVVIRLSPTVVTTGSSWQVPSDWDNANNKIEVIGAGGGGADNGDSGGGGGGGAYARSVGISLNPGDTVTYQVGAGGGAGAGQLGGDGGDTFFCNSTSNCTSITDSAVVVGAKGGKGGDSVSTDVGGIGGIGSSGIFYGTGSTGFSGGNGGNGNGTADSGGGGGGAAGTGGNGCNGGNGDTAATTGGGGGGGGAGGGSCTNGSDGSTTGGDGGAGPDGTAGGVGGNTSDGSPGSNGSGGGGSDSLNYGGLGGFGIEWLAIGSGGGGGGGSNGDYGGDGGLFGGGGGGENMGGLGSRGLIVITYAGKDPTVSSWSVPSDWNSSDNTIEAIGGGGAGNSANQNSGAAGGGGGAYSKSVNVSLVPNNNVGFNVGRAGVLNSVNGQDSYVCNSLTNCNDITSPTVVVGAKGATGGTSATANGVGGAASAGVASGVGSTKTSGGNGGDGNGTGDSGGGGGGAGGPLGDGQAGGIGSTINATDSGGGGGGAGGISSTVGTHGNSGGTGGNGPDGTGGGVGNTSPPAGDGTAGTGGGGGGGATGSSGGNGASYNLWSGVGPGGGGGGVGDNSGADVAGGAGGEFGAGGGGGVYGGAGARGIIVATYTPTNSSPTANSFQRKTWYDGTRYWRASQDQTNQRIMFEYSTDGTSWTENTSARININTNDFSVLADGSNAFIVYTANGYSIYGSPASSYPGISFSWGASQSILTGNGATPPDKYSLPAISKDSSNYIWVAAKYNGNGNYFTKTIKETSSTNNLPEDSNDTVYSLSNSSNTDSVAYANLVSIGSQNMYATFVTGTTIQGCKWVNSSTQWQTSTGSPCTNSVGQISSISDATTSSTTYVPLDGMSLTPGAGNYMVWFSTSVKNTDVNGSTQNLSLFVGGTQVTHTERQVYTEESFDAGEIDSLPVTIQAYVASVGASDAIEVRWKTDGGTATSHERTLTIQPVNSSDISQATDTTPITTTSTGDVLMDNMTLTPGAGDYIIYFSGSVGTGDTAESRVFTSIYVNGAQITGTENNMLVESSFADPATTWGTGSQAYVASIGAGQSIEVRWRNSSGTTSQSLARTLTVQKVTSSNMFQASSAVGTSTTSTSDTQINSMSLTPGAGDYIVHFSTTTENTDVVGSTQNISLYVNGTQVPHSERQMYTEESCDASTTCAFPVSTVAYVENVGATDVIEARYRTTGGVVTAWNRILTAQKITSRGNDVISTGAGNLYSNISTVSDGSGNVHLSYINQSNHTVYQKYTTSWQTPVTLDSNSGNNYTTISLNTYNNDLYAFWIRGNTIFYKKGVSTYTSGDWDASPTSWQTTGTNTFVTSNISDSNEIFAEWYDGTVVDWDKLTLIVPTNTPTPTLTPTPAPGNFQMNGVKLDGLKIN